ncbi:hypothetical protein EIL87_22220 [Saccharopolyspora rhizosphaerae]|uniref:Uncharacterized protein n=1 Tax=Saccharopolyspora rhizosphaerae TaxID=2492662 RepID=A0A426JKJ1_9PSEU|nr:hypothetical protein [Saccharopolyspora rhizosphaerae]RRO13706.1 hypothetical protein EIL87_22220 [Saccharopolyspora rhizosphaerae]
MPGRTLTFVLAAVAVAVPAAATAATAGAAPAPAPVQVQLGEARCQDMSGAVEAVPMLATAFPDPAHTASVEYRITALPEAPRTAYAVKVNGETRGSGSVGGKGLVIGSTALPNGTRSTVEVTSGDRVLASRTYQPAC